RPGPTTLKGNRLLMEGDRHYDYDAYGNLVRERRGHAQCLVTQYRYDSQHRLIGVTTPDGSETSYRYDAFGRRIEKTVDGLTTEFIWQGDQVIAESSDRHYQSYVYEPGTFRPLALLEGAGPEKATPFYYHLDHLGTPQELTSHQGEVVWAARYNGYGKLTELRHGDGKRLEQPLRFQGQYHDRESGLHYNRHRYYNPETGRYLTLDPSKLAGGLNGYRYTLNPTGWVDPLGLEGCPGADKCSPVPGADTPEKKVRVDEGDVTPPTARSVNWKGFSSGKLQPHYQKHVIEQKEFGDISQTEYLKQAKDFSKETGDFNEVNAGNFVIKHDPATGRIFVGHLKSREIRTFYRDDGRSNDAFQSAIDLAKGLIK
ncbi:RHS repeat domain-containing protein, partial [Pseudomonas sp. NR3]|uniref:RHS repeat domain-containing protein n=1 Tax=Pseudomonas sp. NR3 TaxID=3155978 RepID=UPI003B66D4C0